MTEKQRKHLKIPKSPPQSPPQLPPPRAGKPLIFYTRNPKLKPAKNDPSKKPQISTPKNQNPPPKSHLFHDSPYNFRIRRPISASAYVDKQLSDGEDYEEDEDYSCVAVADMNMTLSDYLQMVTSKSSKLGVSSVSRPRYKMKRGCEVKQTVKLRKFKALQYLSEIWKFIRFVPNKVFDFSRYERNLRRLGLWDFAHLKFDEILRVDLLVQMVKEFKLKFNVCYVNKVGIFVSRECVASALKLPVEVGEEEGCEEESFAAEFLVFLEEFVWSWMVLHEGCGWVAPNEVVNWVNLIKEGRPQKVDWAGLVWFMVVKELAKGWGLTDCYYASHLQELIKDQKPKLLREKPVLVLAEAKIVEVDEEKKSEKIGVCGVVEEERFTEMVQKDGKVEKEMEEKESVSDKVRREGDVDADRAEKQSEGSKVEKDVVEDAVNVEMLDVEEPCSEEQKPLEECAGLGLGQTRVTQPESVGASVSSYSDLGQKDGDKDTDMVDSKDDEKRRGETSMVEVMNVENVYVTGKEGCSDMAHNHGGDDDDDGTTLAEKDGEASNKEKVYDKSKVENEENAGSQGCLAEAEDAGNVEMLDAEKSCSGEQKPVEQCIEPAHGQTWVTQTEIIDASVSSYSDSAQKDTDMVDRKDHDRKYGEPSKVEVVDLDGDDEEAEVSEMLGAHQLSWGEERTEEQCTEVRLDRKCIAQLENGCMAGTESSSDMAHNDDKNKVENEEKAGSQWCLDEAEEIVIISNVEFAEHVAQRCKKVQDNNKGFMMRPCNMGSVKMTTEDGEHEEDQEGFCMVPQPHRAENNLMLDDLCAGKSDCNTETCLKKALVWLERAKMYRETAKEKTYQQEKMMQKYSLQIAEKDAEIMQWKCKLDELERKTHAEIAGRDRELHLMNRVIASYRRALEETH